LLFPQNKITTQLYCDGIFTELSIAITLQENGTYPELTQPENSPFLLEVSVKIMESWF
jgi:hypothetical protein